MTVTRLTGVLLVSIGALWGQPVDSMLVVETSQGTEQAIGLINRAVDEQILDETVYRMARTIADKSSHTLKIGKEAFYRQLELPLGEAYDFTSQVMAENLQAVDAKEGICAFLDKRKPEWNDL